MEDTRQDLLVLVWVHGFKGNEVTFESFPERIVHLLSVTHPSLRVSSHVFPAYQTRGELTAATLAFVDWLTELVVNLENDMGKGGGAGKAKVILMGHSMGGLLIADAVRDIAANTRPSDPMWPHIIAVLAFDTPYLGLHPHTFKHSLSTAASYYESARNIASAAGMLSPIALSLGVGKWGKSTSIAPNERTGSPSSKGTAVQTEGEGKTATASLWSNTKAMYGIGAMAVGAAAVGTAYYRREDFVNGWKWGFDHMTFVRNLWDEQAMVQRLVDIDTLGKERELVFANFYTNLPPSGSNVTTRTFCILPSNSHALASRFIPAINTLATDEISAHMGMFNAKTNDGFYDLGLVVVRHIGERVEAEGVGRAQVSKDKEGAEIRADPKEIPSDGWRSVKQGEKIVWVEK